MRTKVSPTKQEEFEEEEEKESLRSDAVQDPAASVVLASFAAAALSQAWRPSLPLPYRAVLWCVVTLPFQILCMLRIPLVVCLWLQVSEEWSV